jgi:hypothetical protein
MNCVLLRVDYEPQGCRVTVSGDCDKIFHGLCLTEFVHAEKSGNLEVGGLRGIVQSHDGSIRPVPPEQGQEGFRVEIFAARRC